MTQTDAILLGLQIMKECQEHGEEAGSCYACPFGKRNGTCLLSDGNSIPKDWNLGKEIYKLVEA